MHVQVGIGVSVRPGLEAYLRTSTSVTQMNPATLLQNITEANSTARLGAGMRMLSASLQRSRGLVSPHGLQR